MDHIQTPAGFSFANEPRHISEITVREGRRQRPSSEAGGVGSDGGEWMEDGREGRRERAREGGMKGEKKRWAS